MLSRYRPWSGAATVTVITAVLVALDIGDGSVHRYWSRHSFSASVLSGVLVLLLTLLIVDRVTRMRDIKNRSRAIGAQAAIIVGQARRVADMIARPVLSDEDRDEASDELRTYTQMLFTSAPLLIDAPVPRAFLESAQRLAGQLYRALRAKDETAEHTKTQLDHAVGQLREAAAPLLQPLSSEQRTAVSSDDG
jgi:hypothetical protein